MLARLIPGIFLLLASHLAAQATLGDLKTRLLHQPLYLSGQWREDKLQFDANGTLLIASATLPFTLSGIEITSLKLESKGLRIDGKRVGLEFSKDKIIRTLLKESIRMEVAAPPGGDYTAVLNSLFFTNLSNFVPSLPPIWQDNKVKALLDPAIPAIEPAKLPSAAPRRVGGGVTPPVVLSMREPQFNSFARAVKLNGKVLVYLQVDEQGLPQKIRILRPLGMGLDELSADAVSQYKFKPAEENGKPVRIEMNVEVNFEIY